MNQLFPIIRRKRRPLLPVESLNDLPPAPLPVADKSEPAQTVATVPPVVPPENESSPQPQDDEAA
jgi:hypothetical protein